MEKKNTLKRILNSICKRSIYQNYKLFNLWKQLPDVKKKEHDVLMNKCVNDLEKGLTKHLLKSLKKSFTPFRDDLLEGQSK